MGPRQKNTALTEKKHYKGVTHPQWLAELYHAGLEVVERALDQAALLLEVRQQRIPQRLRSLIQVQFNTSAQLVQAESQEAALLLEVRQQRLPEGLQMMHSV